MAVSGVHRVMVELVTATEKAGKAIAEGQAQLQKGVEKVMLHTIRVRIGAPPYSYTL